MSWKSTGNLLGWICRHPDTELSTVHRVLISSWIFILYLVFNRCLLVDCYQHRLYFCLRIFCVSDSKEAEERQAWNVCETNEVVSKVESWFVINKRYYLLLSVLIIIIIRRRTRTRMRRRTWTTTTTYSAVRSKYRVALKTKPPNIITLSNIYRFSRFFH